MENYSFFFTSQTFQEPLVIPVSFPDVIGALAPTVTVALVNTVSTLRIAERFTLTHKAFSIITDAKLDFCLSILRHKPVLSNFTSNIPRSY
jgi:hypothetical protein